MSLTREAAWDGAHSTSVLCNPAKITFPRLTRSELFLAVCTILQREREKTHELLQLGLLET